MNKTRLLNHLLQPTAQLIQCPILQDRVLQLMLKAARRDRSMKTRCISLCQLGQWLLWRLTHNTNLDICDQQFDPRISEVLRVLLQAVQFKDQCSRIAVIAIDALKLCTERGQQLAALEQVPQLIISALCKAIEIHRSVTKQPNEAAKLVLTTLMLCLGEFCMALPASIMQQSEDMLILQVLRVLLQVGSGAAPTDDERVELIVDNDFDMQQVDVDLHDEHATQPEEETHSCSLAICLCARAVAMRLLTHLHHFPLAVDAACLSSMMVEHDDVDNAVECKQLERSPSELPSMLTAANFQLFMLNSSQLASFIELPTWDCQVEELVSAAKQVRVLTRDLNGKACWDASLLYRRKQHMIKSLQPVPAQFDSARAALPASANNLKQIDQLICQLTSVCLPEPKVLPEKQALANILEQRVQEQQHFEASKYAGSFYSKRSDPTPERTETPFLHCRLFFAHLGLLDSQHRTRTHLLRRSEKLMRELRNVDVQRCRETHKLAVIYVGAGQEDKTSILLNTHGSSKYEQFVSSLGWEIDLMTHNGFLGGLPRHGCGATAPYYATPFLEVVYHVATRMPSDSSDAMLLKTRHIGNDEVHIVWSEHERDYRRDIFPTNFCDVLIVVYPLRENNLYRVTVNRKPEVPSFGPLLASESLVSGACLATLVRATAINASRTKRASLPMYQQFYEERNRSLNSVFSRYKEHASFVDFASRLYDPLQPPTDIEMPSPTLEAKQSSTSPTPSHRTRRLSSIFKSFGRKLSLHQIVVDEEEHDGAATENSTQTKHPISTPRRRMSSIMKNFLHHPTVGANPSAEHETQPEISTMEAKKNTVKFKTLIKKHLMQPDVNGHKKPIKYTNSIISMDSLE